MVQSPAAADDIEEAAVAGGTRVTAGGVRVRRTVFFQSGTAKGFQPRITKRFLNEIHRQRLITTIPQ